MDKFYITTTIPYANSEPHAGFALEVVQADVLARWNALNGKKVFFLTGTDEHGLKIYKKAVEENLEPKEFVDRISGKYKLLLKELNISNTNFIRTTEENHKKGVYKIWRALEKKGDIYKKSYRGLYCAGCEKFLTEKEVVEGKCPLHPNIQLEDVKEENYFFRLSKYSDRIKSLIKNSNLEIYPEQWKNDFLGLIKDGLRDVSFSREKSNVPWGIPVPDDDSQVIYVWCDALVNYLTGIGFPDNKYKEFWPADIHLVGKDMLRFHAGIWPGMLLSAELPLPKKIIVHGFMTSQGKKMSKSLGNVIKPLELLKKYPADTLRYFLCRNFVFGEDGDFSEKAMIERHNNELADKLGNLVSRTLGLIEKIGIKKSEGNNLIESLDDKKISGLMDRYEFDKVLGEIFLFIDKCNKYIQEKKPWETKDSKILFEVSESIKAIAVLLWPFIPESSEKIAELFGFKINLSEISKPLELSEIKKKEIIFKKI